VPDTNSAHLEALIGMVVHDLRNPAATFGANLGFVREVLGDPSVPQAELLDALSDAQQALTDLMRGLDQLSWMGRWFNDRNALPGGVQDVRLALEGAKQRIKYGRVQFDLPHAEVRARGGEALERLIELLVSNGHQHAPGKLVRVGLVSDGEHAVIEIEDEGRPLAQEFRDTAFTLEGQCDLKGRADGRYGRVAGLFAAGILAQGIGAKLGALERNGRNVFRITLRSDG
jgi:signal transduction histidine kinase